MKNLLPLLILFSLFSCSSPSGDAEKEKVHCDSVMLNNAQQLNSSLEKQFDTIPQPTSDLKKFLSEAKKIKFFPADTAHKFQASDHQNYFGLVNIPNTFGNYEKTAMAKAKNTCLDLVKKNSNIHIEVEEWILKNEADAKRIDDALGAPLEDKTSERFARFPLTFYRVHERMYYIHTDNELDRADMDKVSNLLTEVLSPAQ